MYMRPMQPSCHDLQGSRTDEGHCRMHHGRNEMASAMTETGIQDQHSSNRPSYSSLSLAFIGLHWPHRPRLGAEPVSLCEILSEIGTKLGPITDYSNHSSFFRGRRQQDRVKTTVEVPGMDRCIRDVIG